MNLKKNLKKKVPVKSDKHSILNITIKKYSRILKIRYDMVDNITYISCPFYFNFENMQKEFRLF